MNGMNKVFLMGYVGTAPIQLKGKAGKAYTRFNLATHRMWENSDGVQARRTDWHTIFVWGQLGQQCAERLHKGSTVLIEGMITTFDIPDKEGGKKQKFGVIANQVEFLSPSKPKAHAVDPLNDPPSPPPIEHPVLTATS